MMILSITTQACSTAQNKSDPISMSAEVNREELLEEGLDQCDKALNSCDAALKERGRQIEKQEELLKAQAKELTALQSDRDNALKQPVLWAAVGSGVAVLAGPIAIPFVIIGVIGIGLLLK
jgi:hypothetical protein